MRGFRKVATVAVAAAVVGSAGCGGSSSGDLADVLRYVPGDTGTAIVLSTDLDDERYEELNGELGERLFEGKGLEETAEAFAKEADVSFGDIEDILGNDLVVATSGFGGDAFTAALEVRDAGKLRDLFERFDLEKSGELEGADLYGEVGEDGMAIALDGDVLVVADSRERLRAALKRADGSGGLSVAAFDRATRDLGPDDAILRGYGNPRALLGDERLRRFAAVEWIGALRSGGLNVDIEGDELKVGAALDTNPVGLSDADLPLTTGAARPPVADLPGRLASGTANQSQTTAWLLKAVRAAYPDSDFVRHVAEVERELRIDFEREFLRQFDGPSTSTMAPDGTFAARSTVRDPAGLARLMKRLAPRLPQLILDLQALDTEGLVALFMLAPDAPVATRTFRRGGIEVVDLGTGLYEVRGLEPPAPRELVFGLIGDVFVVASNEGLAREIARAPARPVEGLSGASVARGDLGPFGQLLQRFGLPDAGGEASGAVQITRSRLVARATVELEPRGSGP